MAIARYFSRAGIHELQEVNEEINLSAEDWDRFLCFIVVYDKEKFLEAQRKENPSYANISHALYKRKTPVILGRDDDGIWEKASDIQKYHELSMRYYANSIAFLENVIEEGEEEE